MVNPAGKAPSKTRVRRAKDDAELLAKNGDLELEFNGTVEEVPVFTEAGQTFTLTDGSALSSQYTSRVTLFQF